MPPKFSIELDKALILSNNLNFQQRTSPCEAACPVGNPIQKINSLVKDKHIEEALIFIRSCNPFSGITGRVCSHPCETECNRSNYDEGISIRALERFVSDHADLSKSRNNMNTIKSGKRLAVIGSGPAGLTCAYFCTLLGHEVTVYEGSKALGGMPAAGIPDFRLPKHVVDREVQMVLAQGVSAKINTLVGRDIAFDDIFNEYDACLIATGAWKQKELNIPNAELTIGGLSFLLEVNKGMRCRIGDRVVVVGGGGVAFDCAFTAKRLGAKEIYIVCVEDEEHMCAASEDLIQAKNEGIIILNSHMISKVLPDKQGAGGIEVYEIASHCFDDTGNLSVVPACEKKKELKADAVILATGLSADLAFAGSGFKLTRRGTLSVDSSTMTTSVAGVFGAGDAVNGHGSVAEAIGSGRLAAVGIHNYLMRRSSNSNVSIFIQGNMSVELTENTPAQEPHVVQYDEMFDIGYFKREKRQQTMRFGESQSGVTFDEMDGGLSDLESAAKEAARCFHCGHCQLCGKCIEHCPGYVLEMTENGPAVAFPDECWHCGSCRINCPSACIYYEFPISMLV